MILHLLVDVEIGRRRRVKAGQQFIHHDQQLHLPRFVDEFLFDGLFKLFGSVDRLVRIFLEPVGQHLFVDVVLPQFFGQPIAGFFALGVAKETAGRR